MVWRVGVGQGRTSFGREYLLTGTKRAGVRMGVRFEPVGLDRAVGEFDVQPLWLWLRRDPCAGAVAVRDRCRGAGGSGLAEWR